MTNLAEQLDLLDVDIHESLQEVNVPMYVLDRKGKIAWLNDAANELIPGATGKRFSDVLTPDQVHPARRHFALRMLGKEKFEDHETVVRRPNGERHEIEISSVPLKKRHRIVGVFGVVRADKRVPATRPTAIDAPALTPRQHEALRLLGAGRTTQQMASEMGLSDETVRNHVRGVLAQLGARSRLEAVLRAHRLGLLDEPARGQIDAFGSGIRARNDGGSSAPQNNRSR
jgi:PAS domain S-box-containing protein